MLEWLERLPQKQRNFLLLQHHGWSLPEIARQLKQSESELRKLRVELKYSFQQFQQKETIKE